MDYFRSPTNIGLTVVLIGISLIIYQLHDPTPPPHTVEEKPITLSAGDDSLLTPDAPAVGEQHNKDNFVYSEKDDIVKLGVWVAGGSSLLFENRGQISYASLEQSRRETFSKDSAEKGEKCHLIYYDSELKIDVATVTPRDGEFSEEKHCEEYWEYISETKHNEISAWGYTIFSDENELQKLNESLKNSIGVGQLNSLQIKTLVKDFRAGEELREVKVT